MADNLKLENKDNPFPGIPAAVSDYLPRTNEKGEVIHVMYIRNKFYVSQEFFERLIKEESPLELLNKIWNAKA